MSNQIDYEQEVKRVYKYAHCAYNAMGETYCIYKNKSFNIPLSNRTFSLNTAWLSAYETLKQQGKIWHKTR